MQQLPDCHARTKAGQRRKMLSQRIVGMEFALLGKHQDAEAR